MSDRFVVITEFGPVLVTINPANSGGFDPELLLFGSVNSGEAADVAVEVPLRAFAAKMVEIVEAAGTEGSGMPAGMMQMMISEKATSDLKRIERWAKDNPGQ